MAIALELSVNFGSNLEAAERFCERELPVLYVGNNRIELHKPLLTQVKDIRGNLVITVSILPVAIGYGVALDQGRERIPLDTEMLSELGTRLYQLVKGTTGYKVALVGWDADYQIGIEELCQEYREEIGDGSLHGLVVSHEALKRLPPSEHFVPFDEKHDWIPYHGTEAIT